MRKASPGVTRRVALPRGLAVAWLLLRLRGVVSGLSSRLGRLRGVGQRSSSSPAKPIIARTWLSDGQCSRTHREPRNVAMLHSLVLSKNENDFHVITTGKSRSLGRKSTNENKITSSRCNFFVRSFMHGRVGLFRGLVKFDVLSLEHGTGFLRPHCSAVRPVLALIPDSTIRSFLAARGDSSEKNKRGPTGPSLVRPSESRPV